MSVTSRPTRSGRRWCGITGLVGVGLQILSRTRLSVSCTIRHRTEPEPARPAPRTRQHGEDHLTVFFLATTLGVATAVLFIQSRWIEMALLLITVVLFGLMVRLVRLLSGISTMVPFRLTDSTTVPINTER